MKRKYFYLLVCLQVLIILGMFTYQSLTAFLGTSVTLRANTVDPRDLLKGESVWLTYDIGYIPVALWKGDFSLSELNSEGIRNKKVYVILKNVENESVYEVDYVTNQKPSDGELYIKGRLQYTDVREDGVSGMDILYGIENYYVQENTAYKYENNGKLNVKTSVWNGNINVQSVYW